MSQGNLVLIPLFFIIVTLLMFLGLLLLSDRFSYDNKNRKAQKVDGEKYRSKIREELYKYKEPFFENYEIEGTVVEFYLPEQKIVLTFKPHVFYDIKGKTENIEVDLVAHERVRVVVEQWLGQIERNPPDDPLEAFRHLDIEPTRKRNKIEKAYRKKAKDTHPDLGGSTEEFKKVKEAYERCIEYSEPNENI